MCETPSGKLQMGVREGAETASLVLLSFPGSLGRPLGFAEVRQQVRFLWATTSQKDARLCLFNQQTLAEQLLCARPMPVCCHAIQTLVQNVGGTPGNLNKRQHCS